MHSFPSPKEAQGLPSPTCVPLFAAAGECLLPIPFAETVVARALIAMAGAQAPRGMCIILWPATPGGRLRSRLDPLCAQSSQALVQRGTSFQLLPVTCGAHRADPFRMTSARAELDALPFLSFELPHVDLLHWAAAITAGNMTGAMNRLLDMSLTHVNDRRQFGRTLGKFPVIQQQLSVFAEKVVSAQVAARIGLSDTKLVLDGGRVAIAKSIANESARSSVGIAHAVHGAIGISEAHDLQLYTRRLARWQVSFGSDAYWQQQVGNLRNRSPELTSVDFVRTLLAGPAAAYQ